ncbi:neuritin 1-like b isoform X2 [Silurus meridionalis]|uniref:neuritin 1-like b isoform X2 n=1 Tax=Silurus meridionalis TaxID=175797 RepID=UPI001EECD7BC|nr:neuritin 1-like b isoform X2 [Silurus meridionalis]
MHQLLFISVCLSVCGSVLGSVVPPSCVFVYRGFAQCLVTLGDEVNSQNDNDPDIDSICRSWDSFERCVSSVLSECRGNAAELWESLKVESRRTEFSGNLYEMCASRILTSPGTAVTTDQINQESLKGQGVSSDPVCSVCLLMACMFCALIWFV